METALNAVGRELTLSGRGGGGARDQWLRVVLHSNREVLIAIVERVMLRTLANAERRVELAAVIVRVGARIVLIIRMPLKQIYRFN